MRSPLHFLKRWTSRHSNATNTDSINENDIIIAVVGKTGAGKSTFINAAGGTDVVTVGKRLAVATCEIIHVECNITIDGQQERIIFVETPGFDSEKADEIEKKFEKWLKGMSLKNGKIFGIVYLQRITDNRHTCPPHSNLATMEILCRKSLKVFPSRVVMATTMWSKVKVTDAEVSREKETQEYWKQLRWSKGSAGSKVMRFNKNEDAESILKVLMGGTSSSQTNE